MKMRMLREYLLALSIPNDAVGIGTVASEAYCILREGQHWAVFYFERGQRNSCVLFDNEDAACRDLLQRLFEDELVQRRIGHDGRA